MALGAALATGAPQAYSVVPGPGLLNSGAALLTAYGTNARPGADRPYSASRDRSGVGPPARDAGSGRDHRAAGGLPCPHPHSGRSPWSGRFSHPLHAYRAPGPAALECAMDVWGMSGPVPPISPSKPEQPPPIDEDAVRAAAKLLGAAARPLVVVGGGAQDAAAEVTELSRLLQSPVFAFRRGRGVLDARNPMSVTLPLGHELWGEADVVLGVGTHLHFGLNQWGVDDDLAVIRIDADPEEPARHNRPAVALVGDAKPMLRRLIDSIRAHNRARPSRQEEMLGRQAKLRQRLEVSPPQIAFLDAIRTALPEDGILVEEVTQIGFAARLAYPVYRPRTYDIAGYQDGIWLGFRHRARRAGRPPRLAGGVDQWRWRLHVRRQRARHGGTTSNSTHCRGVRRRSLRERASHPAGALRQPPDRLRPGKPRFRPVRGQFWRRRRACARSSRARGRAWPFAQSPRWTDPDRSAGRGVAVALGVVRLPPNRGKARR